MDIVIIIKKQWHGNDSDNVNDKGSDDNYVVRAIDIPI